MVPFRQAIERAPAKVNLTLHVTGQRADGYHLLDSLVGFVGVYDRVEITPCERMVLAVTGPQAGGVPEDGRNLIWRAAEMMAPEQGFALTLYKRLPAAAGIGGGSADAAALLRALRRKAGLAVPGAEDLARLGADVPVCMSQKPQRMQGIGEVLAPVRGLPGAWLVLVNPGIALETPAVFAALEQRANPAMAESLPAWSGFGEFAAWAAAQRNDLEPPACALQPEIGALLAEIGATPDCALARMSGSGATCFGLYPSEGAARLAATRLRRRNSAWWSAVGPLLGVGKP